MRYFFIQLKIQNGEYQYYSQAVTFSKNKQHTAEGIADEKASTFYEGCNPDEEDGGYYFYAGEVHVKVSLAKEISKEHYDILNQYL